MINWRRMRCCACSMQGRNKKCIQNFGHKTKGKRSLGRSRNKWEGNMRTVLNQWWTAFWAKRPNQEKTCWQATFKVLHIFFYVSIIYDDRSSSVVPVLGWQHLSEINLKNLNELWKIWNSSFLISFYLCLFYNESWVKQTEHTKLLCSTYPVT